MSLADLFNPPRIESKTKSGLRHIKKLIGRKNANEKPGQAPADLPPLRAARYLPLPRHRLGRLLRPVRKESK